MSGDVGDEAGLLEQRARDSNDQTKSKTSM